MPFNCLYAYKDAPRASTNWVSWAFETFVSGTGTGTVLETSDSRKVVNAEVYHAEACGAMATFESITTKTRDRGSSISCMLLEIFAAAHALSREIAVSLFWRAQEFRKMAVSAVTPEETGWIPDHLGLSGNEIAGRPARRELGF